MAVDTPSDSKTSGMRLTGLDAVRGLAILLVVLNHIPHDGWYRFLPAAWHPFITLSSANGKNGVMLLFLLTSFLMSWLYPQPSGAFFGRRYARLFPAFLIMVTVLSVKNLLNQVYHINSIGIEFGLLLGVAMGARVLWELCVRLPQSWQVGKRLLQVWLVTQLGVAAWYVLYLQNISSAVYYQVWSKEAQHITTAVINATLTIPLGTYVAQLDGVYWSLVAEVLFYLVFPFLFVPLLKLFKNRTSWWYAALVFGAAIPFCIGLEKVAQQVLGLAILEPHLVVFFIAGSMIGYHHEWWRKLITQKSISAFFQPWLIFVLLGVILSHIMVFGMLGPAYHAGIRMLVVIPAGWLLLIFLRGDAELPSWTRPVFLTTLGKYSYSMYITHALAINWMTQRIEVHTLWSQLWLTIAIFCTTMVLSVILYHLIEAPYFVARRQSNKRSTSARKDSSLVVPSTLAVYGFTLAVLGSIYIAYRPPTATFTQVYRHYLPNWQQLFFDHTQELTAEPLAFTFTGQASNLGMITAHLASKEVPNSTDISKDPSLLHMQLTTTDGHEVGHATFEAHTLGENTYHPFGFPVQPTSNTTTYVLKYWVEFKDFSRRIFLTSNEGAFTAVYFVNKRDVLTHPMLALNWILHKSLEPLQTRGFWLTLGLVTPLVLLLQGLQYSHFTLQHKKNPA